tara:strand:- start:4067 stop:4273 length:207 start_codon:yes stop_codon:yes gene_type:complete
MTGEELKELRKDTNTTQSEIADYLGYYTNGIPNRSVISRWEKGRTPINPRISMLLAQFFKKIEEKETV